MNRPSPVVRWTIGPVSDSGFQSLGLSITSFLHFYPHVEPIVCFNCQPDKISWLPDHILRYDQSRHQDDEIKPIGVAWKLYPPRLAPERHELFIDNDVVFLEPIPEIDQFFNGDITLLLQGLSRNYGRYEKHVPPGYCINSGIFGCPPGFNLNKYVKFFGGIAWEENVANRSKTFDEQGIVALALLQYKKFAIIPDTSVTNCEMKLINGKGLHFVGVNRNKFHEPFRLFRSRLSKIHL